MHLSPPTASVLPFERAHELWQRGEHEAALQIGTAILSTSPGHVAAALLVTRALFERGRGARLGEIALRLSEAFSRRGDLPQAWLAAELAAACGAATREDLFGALARSFSKGSPRLSVDPPKAPLATGRVTSAALAELGSGEGLVRAAERALGLFFATDDVVAGGSLLPILPLFSALTQNSLHRLLNRLQPRELLPGDAALRQGEPGHEVFIVARGLVAIERAAPDGRSTPIAELGPGAIFGEMAVVSQAPRAASALARQATQLLVISRAALDALDEEDPVLGRELGKFCYRRMIGNLIRHSPILSAVDPARRRDLVGRFTTEHFQRGETLVRQGQQANRLFLIASGAVGVRGRDAEGDRIAITELGPGEVVGEIALCLRQPANADVVALHPTVALSLTADQFQDVIRDHPGLLPRLYDLAAVRAQETRSILAQRILEDGDTVVV